jgi:hypothetical protein
MLISCSARLIEQVDIKSSSLCCPILEDARRYKMIIKHNLTIEIECEKEPDQKYDASQRDGKFYIPVAMSNDSTGGMGDTLTIGTTSTHIPLESIAMILDLCDQLDGHLVISRSVTASISNPTD